MSKINLMPEVKVEQIKIKRYNFMATFAAIIVLTIIALGVTILLGYKYILARDIKNTNADITALREELKGYQELEEMVVNIDQGLTSINEITLSQHQWSGFLSHLEKVTPNDIQFVDFSQEGMKFTATAKGKNVSSIGRLIQSLENYEVQAGSSEESNQAEVSGSKLFRAVDVDGYTKDVDGTVDFSITFELQEGVLW